MAREDQKYVTDLCDEVLGIKALREHTFEFLRGDPGKRFTMGKQLPVDAFYPSLNLVIEFEERHHVAPVRLFDKPNRVTISGINRAEQRTRYIRRRKEILPQHNIEIVFIGYGEFELKGKRLKRIKENDLAVVRKRLGPFINRPFDRSGHDAH